MVFEFLAHKPKAYLWFAISLLFIVLLNALLIQSLQAILLDWNALVQQSVFLVVPWILFLFLPSVFAAMLVYYSLMRRYRFSLSETGLTIDLLNSKNEISGASKIFSWAAVKEFKFSDFEDNEYFTLVFHDKKNNLILHRDSGEFELFFEELKKYMN